MLERLGCQHVGALADLSAAIGVDSRDGASGTIKVATRQVLTDYWVTHGCEATRKYSVAHVQGVSTFSATPNFFDLASPL